MIYTRSSTEALGKRELIHSPGTGIAHWGTEFFGPRSSTTVAPGPQATMTDMIPHESLVPHFHGVTQYQLFAAGSGTIGKGCDELRPLTVQYKDHHTAYGPVVAGPQGLSFMALRIRTGDSAPVYLDRPGYREKLKPSKRRNWLSKPIVLSTEPVMQFRKEAAWEPLFDPAKIDDELGAFVLRLGAGMTTMGPNPKQAGGYYVFVANGSLQKDGQALPLWSMVVV
ncbi:MAG TPA: hypothetical protein VK663_14950, partial [Burkholderiales bacterium]|nr:hypothetical protein [Burkholderiales bacterium]